MSIKQIDNGSIPIANRQHRPVWTECDTGWLLSVGRLPRKNDQLEVGIIEPDLAVLTRRGEPTIGGEC
jgi:hypothetical protein